MLATAVVLACFTLLALMLAWSRALAGRRRSAIGHLMLATVTLVAGGFLGWLAARLAPYAPLVPGQPVAEILFEQTGTRRFRATVTQLPEGRMQILELPGHQWRIDARTLAWQAAASNLGLRPLFQVERITARNTGSAGTPDVLAADFVLSGAGSDDLWTRVRSGSGWARFASADRSIGPWRPMANGARFVVRLAGTGIAVEPMNEAAATAMRGLR